MSVLSECSNVTKGFLSSQLILDVIEFIIERLTQKSENSDEILSDFYTHGGHLTIH